MENQSMWVGLLSPWIGPILMFCLFAPGFYFGRLLYLKHPDNRLKRFLLWRPKNIWQLIVMAFIPNAFIIAAAAWYEYNNHNWF